VGSSPTLKDSLSRLGASGSGPSSTNSLLESVAITVSIDIRRCDGNSIVGGR